MKLSVLMPVYNESRTLRTVVERAVQAPVDLEVELVCVDDCSTDNPLDILHDLARSDSRIKVSFQTGESWERTYHTVCVKALQSSRSRFEATRQRLVREGPDVAGSRSRAMS